MMSVSVLIPTFRRPDSFLRAASSVFAQKDVAHIELIAIDNSPEGSTIPVFQALEGEAPMPFRWAHAPEPGVAHARNAALTLARGDLIAWLDDDEEASPRWLAELIATRNATGAQSVFGPVRASAPAGAANAAFFEQLYSRQGPAQNGVVAEPFGIGNSLQPRRMFDEPAPFDGRANERGGEDDVLFNTWADVGAVFAWAKDAIVTEHIGPERARLGHGLKRAFAYGQGPSELAWAARDLTGLARHMLIGAAQAVIYLAASAALALPARSRALIALDRAARGAGKVFWFLEQRFYGVSLARQPA